MQWHTCQDQLSSVAGVALSPPFFLLLLLDDHGNAALFRGIGIGTLKHDFTCRLFMIRAYHNNDDEVKEEDEEQVRDAFIVKEKDMCVYTHTQPL